MERESLCALAPLVHILFSTKLYIRLLAVSKYGFLMKSVDGLLAFIFFPIYFSPSNDHVAQSVTALPAKLTVSVFLVFWYPFKMTLTKLRVCVKPFHHTAINKTPLPRSNNFPSIFFGLPKLLWDSPDAAVHPKSSCFTPSVQAGPSHPAAVSAAIVEQGLLFVFNCLSKFAFEWHAAAN